MSGMTNNEIGGVRGDVNGAGRGGGSLRRMGWAVATLWVLCCLAAAPATAGSEKDAGGKRDLVVMTHNLYQGADVGRIISEPNPYLIPVRVAETLAMVVANDFPARARAGWRTRWQRCGRT